jgi:hypothetical protein
LLEWIYRFSVPDFEPAKTAKRGIISINLSGYEGNATKENFGSFLWNKNTSCIPLFALDSLPDFLPFTLISDFFNTHFLPKRKGNLFSISPSGFETRPVFI